MILCERGIHAKATPARSCLDLAAVTVLKEHTHLPVIVDPRTPPAVARSSSRSRSPPPPAAPMA